MKVLIVEDDRDTAEVVKESLVAEHHVVEIAPDGADGSFLARNYEYDAIVLDYSLPKKDGLAVCREVRDAGRKTPIIFLSSTEDPETKVAAFKDGADDYVTKPFSLKELSARLQAVTKRGSGVVQTVFQIDDLIMNMDTHTITRGGKDIQLTRKEFSLLEYLMRNPGIVLSRAAIMEHVWTADRDPFSNTVEAHMSNVRRKINAGGRPDLIANIAGRGYMMDVPERLKRL